MPIQPEKFLTIMTGILLGDQIPEPPKATLVVDLMLATGRADIRAFGLSMLPSIWPGDLLTIQSAQAPDISAGDIVAIRQNGHWLVHRVVGRSATQLITRGDCVPANDPPAHIDDLIGKVVLVARESKEFVPGRKLSLFQRCLAWLLCHSGRLRKLMLNFHQARESRLRSEVRSKFRHRTA
jgi:hypothetical protein